MPKRPKKRRFLVLLIPYAVVLGLLAAVNLALPHFDPTLDIPLARDIEEDGMAFRQIDRAYLEPFFPAGSPLVPELKSTYLQRVKKPGSLRVLCIGESSMFGVPFQWAATIPALVRKQLRHLYPDREVEVINLGASAINTNVIREMVPGFLSLEPDLVLVYTGHNEYYGPDGVGASWIERMIPGLTPWKYRARRLPLVLALQRFIAGLGSRKADASKSLMEQVSGGEEIPLDSPESERIFRQFQGNLRDIVRGFRREGVPVILGDISSNLMFPPFAPRPGAGFRGIAPAVTAGRFGEADSLLSRGLAEDSTNAWYLYWRGRLSLAAGDSAVAVQFLERARDQDLLKFRAPGRINEIIHRIGREESVPVVPIDSLLRARSPHGITDTTYFCEHLHPNFAGYDLIARAFIAAIVDLHPAGLAGPPAASLLPFQADSLSVPWLDLGYGALSLRSLTSRWPFSEMPVRRDALAGHEAWEIDIVKDIIAGKTGWVDACLQYAYEAHQHHREDAVVTTLSSLVEEHPWTYLFRYGLAGALEKVGRVPEALEQYRRTLALNPGFFQASVDYALLLAHGGHAQEAWGLLEAFRADASFRDASVAIRAKALYGLASIAAGRDSISASLGFLDESLRLAPSYQDALALRSQILAGRRQGADHNAVSE